MLESEQIEKELLFFGHSNDIFHLPDLETLPYDTFSPHQDIISDRFIYAVPFNPRSIGHFDITYQFSYTALAPC